MILEEMLSDELLQQVAEKIGLSKRAIEMQVKKLREQGKVNRIGATKNGLWEVRG